MGDYKGKARGQRPCDAGAFTRFSYHVTIDFNVLEYQTRCHEHLSVSLSGFLRSPQRPTRSSRTTRALRITKKTSSSSKRRLKAYTQKHRKLLKKKAAAAEKSGRRW